MIAEGKQLPTSQWLGKVSTAFHICASPFFELDLDYVPSLGIKNYICLTRKCWENSFAKDLKQVFEDYLIMESDSDHSQVEAFLQKHLSDPQSTRIIYWSDADILE